MITFETLKYKNFLSTGNTPTTIQLNKDSATLVVGSNGAGKSTMLDALSFALFGKPHRNINKPQLVNSINGKNCEVEVTFSVGGNRYRVFRAIKPGKFQIYQNDKLLNQEAHTRDYQKVLETNILKLNHKSFHQVVVLGSSSFIPFMQLPAAQRRNVIEDLLDIGIFTKMNVLTKDRYTKLKNDLNNTVNDMNITREKIRLQQKHIRELKDIDLKQTVKNEKKIQELKDEADLIDQRNKDLQKEFDDAWPSLRESINDIISNQNQLNSNKTTHNHDIKALVKQAKFYETNDCCPTCDQLLSDDLKSTKRKDIEKDATSINDALKEINGELEGLQNKFDILKREQRELDKIKTDIRMNEGTIHHCNDQIKSLESNSSVKSIDTTQAEKDLNDNQDHVRELEKQQQSQAHVRTYIEAIFELLKDTGIKTKIIREYLPVMNKLINQYLQILDFFVSFNLDESFNETIKSRHRDDFSYSSFSEGEKQRIDLALLFSWRHIAKMKNSANTNLLILDETFDSSLDGDGVDNLIKILYTLRDDSNVFIISHKQDLLDGKFPAKIEFKKQNNFSSASCS
jgi:DNA repair exonuclease SbcCD ATPase subunit